MTTDRTTLCSNTATGGGGSPGCSSSYSGIGPDGFPGGPGGVALGGAICNLGSLSVTCSTLASNFVTGGYGGGGGEADAGFEDTGNGASAGNGGSGLGGALHSSGAASLVNCTIAYNTGSGGPGGSGGASQMPTSPRRHQGAGGTAEAADPVLAVLMGRATSSTALWPRTGASPVWAATVAEAILPAGPERAGPRGAVRRAARW